MSEDDAKSLLGKYLEEESQENKDLTREEIDFIFDDFNSSMSYLTTEDFNTIYLHATEYQKTDSLQNIVYDAVLRAFSLGYYRAKKDNFEKEPKQDLV